MSMYITDNDGSATLSSAPNELPSGLWPHEYGLWQELEIMEVREYRYTSPFLHVFAVF